MRQEAKQPPELGRPPGPPLHFSAGHQTAGPQSGKRGGGGDRGTNRTKTPRLCALFREDRGVSRGLQCQEPCTHSCPRTAHKLGCEAIRAGGPFSPGPRAAWCLPRLRSHMVVTHAGKILKQYTTSSFYSWFYLQPTASGPDSLLWNCLPQSRPRPPGTRPAGSAGPLLGGCAVCPYTHSLQTSFPSLQALQPRLPSCFPDSSLAQSRAVSRAPSTFPMATQTIPHRQATPPLPHRTYTPQPLICPM